MAFTHHHPMDRMVISPVGRIVRRTHPERA
jgi:hypothetical protein